MRDPAGILRRRCVALACLAMNLIAGGQALAGEVPPDGPVVIELHAAPLQSTLAALGELSGLDIVVGSDLASKRVEFSGGAGNWPDAIDAVVHAAGAQMRTLDSGIGVVATACTLAAPPPQPIALPLERHSAISFRFRGVPLSSALAVLADFIHVPDEPVLPSRLTLGINARLVEAGDLIDAIRIAQALEPAPDGHGALALTRRIDAGCGSVEPAGKPAVGDPSADPLERFAPGRMKMAGYVRSGLARPAALLELPDATAIVVRAGATLGPARTAVVGVFGDGVHLATDASARPAIAFRPRNAQALPAPATLRRRADHDDAAALRELGAMFAHGNGVTQDAAASVRWFRRAAELGDAEAMHALADDLLRGRGVDKDRAAAQAWFERAAKLGQLESQSSLGTLLTEDCEAPTRRASCDEGRGWLLAAAERGSASAQFLLSNYDGRHASDDPGHAGERRWAQAAALQGNAVAQMELGRLLTPTDARAAVRWLARAATHEASVSSDLGAVYFALSGSPDDDREAAWWLRKTLDAGDPSALARLGIMALRGRAMERDPLQAEAWLTAAANQGYVAARVVLATMYLQGDGIPRQPSRAVDWLRKAAMATPGEQSARQLRDWPVRLAPRGDTIAQRRLGGLLLSGEPGVDEPVEGCQWLMVAASRGDAEAATQLVNDAARLSAEQRAEGRRRADAWLAAHDGP